MNLHWKRIIGLGGVLASTAALTLGALPEASAAPTFKVSSIPAGVSSGGELALDAGRNQLFISDNQNFLSTKGGTDISVHPEVPAPKVTVFSLTAQRPVSAISFVGQPWGRMPFGGVPLLPIPQVPDGIGLDTTHGRVVTSNSHNDSVSVASMNARTTDARNLINIPGSHPMGVAVDSAANRAYVGLNSKNSVAVIDTAKRRKVGDISGIFAASFVALDKSRHRLYVGNADYMNKKTNYLTVVDTRNNKIVKKIATPSNSRPALDAQTGRVFAASFDTGKISVVDPDSLTIVKTISTNTTPSKIVVDAQRRLAYTANLQKRTMTVIDADTFAAIRTIPVGAPLHTIAVDPKTGTVYGTQHQSGKLTVVKVTR